MELIKIVDYEGETHYLNKDYIISVRPFRACGIDNTNRKSKIEYGTSFVDCIYMKEAVGAVASKIAKEYLI